MNRYLIEVEGRVITSALPEHEICELYRRAKNQRKQIKILTELALISKADVNAILSKNGYVLEDVNSKKKSESSTSNRFVWTDELTETLIEKYSEGRKPAEIAEDLGVSSKMVNNKLGKLRRQGKVPYTTEVQSVDVAVAEAIANVIDTATPTPDEQLLNSIEFLLKAKELFGGQVISVIGNGDTSVCTFERAGAVYELSLERIDVSSENEERTVHDA